MNKYTKKDKDKIIEILNNDRIVIMETDTVYGIMAKANKNNEIRINEIKKRDKNKKISIIFPDKDSLDSYLYDISYYKREYMNDRLPGKYTFIVKLKKFMDFEREDFGVRVTQDSYLQDILKEVGPVMASSCNIKEDNPYKSMDEIIRVFGELDIDIVEGSNNIDKASLVISLIDDIEIIRE